MKQTLLLVLCTVFFFKAHAQQLGPQDTLRSTNRTFGPADSLLHIMDGFSSNFFFQAQQNTLSASDFLKPGFVAFAEAQRSVKPFLFSAFEAIKAFTLVLITLPIFYSCSHQVISTMTRLIAAADWPVPISPWPPAQ